ncbi:MAG: maleylpyruvate isomerase family mycothiol-dependent enzyme [Propionicimonas sp.]
MTPQLNDALDWAMDGTERVRAALAGLGEDDGAWLADSGLPGWTRKHLVAHLAGNAGALGNLVSWALTGVETPMYASPDQRNADIAAGAQRPASELSAWFESSAAALAGGWRSLADEQWEAPVKTVQGRIVPVSQTPWLRAREVMVHAVDLGTGVTFAQLPEAFLVALVDDIVTRRNTIGGPALVIAPDGLEERWAVTGAGEPVTVAGPLAEVAAWLAGRPASGLRAEGGLPDLPAWL